VTGSSGLMAVAAALLVGAGVMSAETAELTLRASVVGAPSGAPLTIELLRWSTDAERAPLLTALTPPPPSAAAAPGAPAAAGPAGRAGAGGRAAGRGGRGGGRGGAAAAPASPAVRLSAAVKAAPTVGFIWGDGPTGYSIRYAWRSSSADGRERIVLVTDRRIGAHAPSWPQSSEAVVKAGAGADADEVEYTVIEIRVDGKGVGEAKSSLAAGVIVDADAKTLALDGYAAAPALLKVTR
jgi:hypothetical protein